MKTSELDKAKKLVMRALASGATPKIDGEWVTWDGPLSTELLIEMTSLKGNALAKAVRDYSANVGGLPRRDSDVGSSA